MTGDVHEEEVVLSLDSGPWEPFEPQGGSGSKDKYPPSLTGVVQWARRATDPAIALRDGSVQLAVLHMKGGPSPWTKIQPGPMGVMVLLEGSAELQKQSGEVVSLEAPCMTVRRPGLDLKFRYLTPYRGIYILGW